MKLPILSGEEVIKILTKKFGFEVSRQKGSHIVLRKFQGNRKIVTVVPNHKEIAVGTLRGILKLAQVSPKEFLEKYHN
jgi:predicted RNA binding protein YcfA (HicA-like mRNA interferase family)